MSGAIFAYWGGSLLVFLLGNGLERLLVTRGHDRLATGISLVFRLGALALVGTGLWQLPQHTRWPSHLGGFAWEDVVRAVMALGVGYALVDRTTNLVEGRLRSAGQLHRSLVVGKALRYGGVLVLISVAASMVGFDLTAFFATAGVIGVAIGFAAQNSLSNLIAGMFLLVDRPFEVGHIVEIEQTQGIVMEVTLLSTVVRTHDNLMVRWPNEAVLKARIVNYSKYPVRRVELLVRVPADAPLSMLCTKVQEAVAELAEVLVEPSPKVYVKDLDDNGATLTVRGWVRRDAFLSGRDAIAIAAQQAVIAAGVRPFVPVHEIRLPAPPTA